MSRKYPKSIYVDSHTDEQIRAHMKKEELGENLTDLQITRAIRAYRARGCTGYKSDALCRFAERSDDLTEFELITDPTDMITNARQMSKDMLKPVSKSQLWRALEKMKKQKRGPNGYEDLLKAARKYKGRPSLTQKLFDYFKQDNPISKGLLDSFEEDSDAEEGPSTSNAQEPSSRQKRGRSLPGRAEARGDESSADRSAQGIRNYSLTRKESKARLNALENSRNPTGNSASRPPIPLHSSSKAPVPTEAPSTSDAPGPSGATSKPIEAVKIEHQGSPSRKRKDLNASSSSSNPSESSTSGNPKPRKNRGLGREKSGESPLENPDEPTSSETPGPSEPSSSSNNRKKTNNQ